MSDNIFDKFDSMYDVNALAAEVNDVNGNNEERVEVSDGSRIVTVEKLELVESKKGKPMVSAWFRIYEGEYQNQILFYNQVLTAGFTIKKSNEFLTGFSSGVPVEFKSFKQYGEMIAEIYAKVQGYQFQIGRETNEKGFYEWCIDPVVVDTDELPF